MKLLFFRSAYLDENRVSVNAKPRFCQKFWSFSPKTPISPPKTRVFRVKSAQSKGKKSKVNKRE